jgi:preprotein translocase subunit SecG
LQVFVFLSVILILVGLLSIVVILLQAGKGGGLAAMGGAGATESFIGGRQAATILTKATWTGLGVFLGLALILSVMSSRAQQPASILQDEFRQTSPVAPQPLPLEGLQPAQPGSDGGAAPAAPATPGTDATPPGN